MLCLACAVAMVALAPGPLGAFFAIVVVLAGAGLASAARRDRKRARAASDHFLEITSEAVTLAEGPRRLHIAFSEVVSVEVDEDRVVVEVARRDGAPLIVTPRFRGVGLHELASEIDRRWRCATAAARD